MIPNSTDPMHARQSGHTGDYSWIRIVSATTLVLIFVCSLPLNSLLLHVLRTKHLFLMKRNRFVGVLLAGELLVRVFGSPLLISSVIADRWLFGHSGCIFYGFLMTWLGITSSSLLSVIAIERFLIVYPKVPIFIKKRSALVIAALCVFHGIAWAVVPLSDYNDYVLEPSGVSCAPNWAPEHRVFVIAIATEAFVAPFICMFVCYGTILMKVRTINQTQVMSQISDIELSKTMVLIMASYLICWTPYAVFACIGTFGLDMSNVPLEVTLIPLTCAKTAGMLNPIFYGLKNVAMRKEMLTVCKRWLFRRYTVELQLDVGNPDEGVRNTNQTTNYGPVGITCTDRERLHLPGVVHIANHYRENSFDVYNPRTQRYSERGRTNTYKSIFSNDLVVDLEMRSPNSRDRYVTGFTPRNAIVESDSV